MNSIAINILSFSKGMTSASITEDNLDTELLSE